MNHQIKVSVEAPRGFSPNGCGDASDSVQRGKIGSGWRIGTTEDNSMTGKYLIAAARVSACAVAASGLRLKLG
jgi:hypothetical protein